MAIKNIIFDLCGPIITIDIEMINGKLREFGVSEEKPYQKLRDEGLTKRYEAGLVSPEEFCDELRKILHSGMSNEQINKAWNTLIKDFPKSHIELLRQLKREYRLFLLSNSDEINAQYFKDYLNGSSGFDLVHECFDEVFFSCELKDRKPSPPVFQHIVDKHRLEPSETLVVDDCKKHCDGAASIGLHTYFLKPGEDICEISIATL